MAKRNIRLVIVGGGFGGIKLVRSLADIDGIHITLISDRAFFRYSPALYRTATGHRNKESNVSIKVLLKGISNVHFVTARATKINRQKRLITTAGNTTFEYDYAVLALGVVTSYFGIDGLEQYAYGIKSAEEVDKLRAHLHQELVNGEAFDKNYVVVGGGPTGVELSAALVYYLNRMAKRHHIKEHKIHLELIEAAHRLLPNSSRLGSALARKRLTKLGVNVVTNCRVQGETKSTLMANGKSIPTQTVVWTAGVTNNPFFLANAAQFQLNEHRKVVVDGYLRVDERTFVIGDNAATPYSGLALTAIHDGTYVARYLKQTLHHRVIEPYKASTPISAVPIGPRYAIVNWRGHTFGGFTASLVRLFADLIGYTDIMGVRRAVGMWLKRYEYEERCPICNALTLSDVMND